MEHRDEERDLIFSMAYAIWKASRKKLDIDDVRLTLVPKVLEHLRLCGWSWTKKPPVEPHG